MSINRTFVYGYSVSSWILEFLAIMLALSLSLDHVVLLYNWSLLVYPVYTIEAMARLCATRPLLLHWEMYGGGHSEYKIYEMISN